MQCVVFSNADPYVIQAFLAWLYGELTSQELIIIAGIVNPVDITWLSCWITQTVGA